MQGRERNIGLVGLLITLIIGIPSMIASVINMLKNPEITLIAVMYVIKVLFIIILSVLLFSSIKYPNIRFWIKKHILTTGVIVVALIITIFLSTGKCAYGTCPSNDIDNSVNVLANSNNLPANGIQNVINPNPPISHKIGEIIKIGHWPHGAESIEWEILEIMKDDSAIVLSTKVIDLKNYHNSNQIITWENCDLRKWLNDSFYNEAFEESEKNIIEKKHNINSNNYGEFIKEKHKPFWDKWNKSEPGDKTKFDEKWNTFGGKDTEDYIWLLSLQDLKEYNERFATDSRRIAKPMDYLSKTHNFCNSKNNRKYCAKNNTVGNSRWWLRSPGKSGNTAALVYFDGFVVTSGYLVNLDNKKFEGIGVRPAMKINLKKL